MRKIPFKIERSFVMPCSDAAYLVDGDDPQEMLHAQVVESISTEIEVTIGGVTMHLAGLMYPDHWSSDWAEQGVEDPYEFIAALVTDATL